MKKEVIWELIKDNFLIFMAAEEMLFGVVLNGLLIFILDQLVRIRLKIK